jgi:hypothetical protein
MYMLQLEWEIGHFGKSRLLIVGYGQIRYHSTPHGRFSLRVFNLRPKKSKL